MVLAVIVALVFPSLYPAFEALLNNELWAGVALGAVWVPIEAVFLKMAGATPGKWLFGITVTSREGERPSFVQALERSGDVFFRGTGLGLPLVAFFTQLFAYQKLTKSGITSWDQSCATLVTHKKWGFGRAMLCTVAVLCSFMLLGWLNSIPLD